MTDKAKKPPINHKSVERFENEGGTTRAGELSRKKRPRDPNQLGIRQAEWDKSSLNLFVTFTSGNTYTYYGVPEWKYVGLLSASSAGQYFNDNIRDQHSSNRH